MPANADLAPVPGAAAGTEDAAVPISNTTLAEMVPPAQATLGAAGFLRTALFRVAGVADIPRSNMGRAAPIAAPGAAAAAMVGLDVAGGTAATPGIEALPATNVTLTQDGTKSEQATLAAEPSPSAQAEPVVVASIVAAVPPGRHRVHGRRRAPRRCRRARSCSDHGSCDHGECRAPDGRLGHGRRRAPSQRRAHDRQSAHGRRGAIRGRRFPRR